MLAAATDRPRKAAVTAFSARESAVEVARMFEPRGNRESTAEEKRRKRLASLRAARLQAALRRPDGSSAPMPSATFIGARESLLVYPDTVVIQRATDLGSVREKRYPFQDIDRLLRSGGVEEAVAVVPKGSSLIVLDVSANPWSVSANPEENPHFWHDFYDLAPSVPVETVASPRAAIAGLCRGVRDPARLAELPFEVGFTKFPDFSVSRLLHNDYDSIALDNTRKKIGILNKEFLAGRLYEAADVMSVEVYEDGRSISQASRGRQVGAALVGNIIAGGPGAVIGGLGARVRSRDEIHDLTLRLTLNDDEFPIFDLRLNKAAVLRGSVLHSRLSTTARGWASLVEALMRTGGASFQASGASGEEEPLNSVPTTYGLADELAKLSALRASGVLSEEEFSRLKQRLIS